VTEGNTGLHPNPEKESTMKTTLFAVSSLLVLAACERISDPVPCPPYIAPAVTVTVQDSITGANVTGGADVALIGGTMMESAVGQPGASSVSLYGPAGTFTVTASQSGYQTWTKTGVKVEDGECVVQTVELTARLKPAP
jgi:hypothetical protein